jgi:hypothetical protein
MRRERHLLFFSFQLSVLIFLNINIGQVPEPGQFCVRLLCVMRIDMAEKKVLNAPGGNLCGVDEDEDDDFEIVIAPTKVCDPTNPAAHSFMSCRMCQLTMLCCLHGIPNFQGGEAETMPLSQALEMSRSLGWRETGFIDSEVSPAARH